MKTIAVIDDDIHIGDVLTEILENEGYLVVRAYSGTEALYLLSQRKPELILLDLILPGLSGEEVLSHIKKVPVIVLSAKVQVQDKIKLLLGGAADYMTKPFDTEELLARITVQLRREQSSEEDQDTFGYSMVVSSHELYPEAVNMVNVLEESLLSFYGMMRERGIQPEIILPEKAVWRRLDVSALNRVFSNIIGNALKYSDGDFCVRMGEDGQVTFSNRAKSLNPLVVGRLFDRFYTVEVSRSSTGLGLSIAKLLTERMGGRIRASYIEDRLLITLNFHSQDRQS